MNFAEQLLALWDEYLDHRGEVFTPTMTGFMLWVKENRKALLSESVKAPEHRRVSYNDNEGKDYSALQLNSEVVKDNDSVERGVVQQRWGELAPSAKKLHEHDIQTLHANGYALSRIRQMLRLDITVGQMQGIIARVKQRRIKRQP